MIISSFKWTAASNWNRFFYFAIGDFQILILFWWKHSKHKDTFVPFLWKEKHKMLLLYYLFYLFSGAFVLMVLWRRRHLYMLSWKCYGPLGVPLLGNAWMLRNMDGMFFIKRKKSLEFFVYKQNPGWHNHYGENTPNSHFNCFSSLFYHHQKMYKLYTYMNI